MKKRQGFSFGVSSALSPVENAGNEQSRYETIKRSSISNWYIKKEMWWGRKKMEKSFKAVVGEIWGLGETQ